MYLLQAMYDSTVFPVFTLGLQSLMLLVSQWVDREFMQSTNSCNIDTCGSDSSEANRKWTFSDYERPFGGQFSANISIFCFTLLLTVSGITANL